MSIIGNNLSHYPLENHYRVCRQYIYQSIAWAEIRNRIQREGTACIEISNAISLFPHLELDADYCLVCYMTSEYHGIWGRVTAIKNGKPWERKHDGSKQVMHKPFGNELDMPEYAVPPMEAIYNDGTAEGYFEAVLCSLFLQAIPYTHFEQDRWSLIMNTIPNNFEENWDCQVALADWRPRYTKHTITSLSRRVENGIGASDGKDRIYLTQFNFCTSVNDYLLRTVLRTQRPIDTNHITDSNRYGKTRKCCVFTQSSVLVAVQKE